MKPEKAVYASCGTGSEGVSACRAQPGSEIGLMPDSSALPVDILCWRPFPRQHVLSLLSRIAAPISLPHMRCGGHPLGRPMNPPVEVLMPRVTVLLARGIGFLMGSGWYRVFHHGRFAPKSRRGRRAPRGRHRVATHPSGDERPMDPIANLRQTLDRCVRCSASRAIGNCTVASVRSAYRRRSPDRRIASTSRNISTPAGPPGRSVWFGRLIDIARPGAQFSHGCRKGG